VQAQSAGSKGGEHMAVVAELNDGNFAETIAEGVTLVDFWAPWCAPCMMQGPIVEEVAKSVGEKAVVAKANVDEAPRAAAQFGIRAIPTVIVFKDGKVAKQFVGVTREGELISAIDSAR
jgi:thioredoxin 1